MDTVQGHPEGLGGGVSSHYEVVSRQMCRIVGTFDTESPSLYYFADDLFIFRLFKTFGLVLQHSGSKSS